MENFLFLRSERMPSTLTTGISQSIFTWSKARLETPEQLKSFQILQQRHQNTSWTLFLKSTFFTEHFGTTANLIRIGY